MLKLSDLLRTEGVLLLLITGPTNMGRALIAEVFPGQRELALTCGPYPMDVIYCEDQEVEFTSRSCIRIKDIGGDCHDIQVVKLFNTATTG